MKLERGNRVFYTILPTIPVCVYQLQGEISEVAELISVKDHSQHTIGVEFSSRTVKLGEKRIKLQVCIYATRSSH